MKMIRHLFSNSLDLRHHFSPHSSTMVMALLWMHNSSRPASEWPRREIVHHRTG
jgi:hypothetical protein